MNPTLLESNNRILVIDDNPAIHQDFRKILSRNPAANTELDQAADELFGENSAVSRQASFEIDSALQGQEGLVMVQKALQEARPYAMAFVDVRMPPGWDGVETISQLWKISPALQVVICTAYSDYSWESVVQALGHSDNLVILKKPFDNIEVLQLAHALTRKWRLVEQEKIKLQDLAQMVEQRTQELAAAHARLQSEIQARIQTEMALRLSQERFEKAFCASPIAMAIQTFQEERFIDANQRFLALTGLPREQILGRVPLDLPPLLAPELRQQVRQRLGEGRPVRDLEGVLRHVSGGLRQIVLSAELFNIGVEPYALFIAQDATERIRLEGQLREAQKMEAVGQLAAGVAHDFNNLLTIIQGHAKLRLSSENLDREIRVSLQEVAEASQRAARLTRQLLAFGRRQLMQRKKVQLNELIHNLHPMIAGVLGEHIQLQCELTEQMPVLHADTSQLEQVLMNLVLNAKEAMPKGGQLTVRTEWQSIDPAYVGQHKEAQLGEFIALTVRDTGDGMGPDVLPHIFEPFFTTKDASQGAGMGLAVVYGIVKQHGGWIEVTSQPGQGSDFRILLPPASPEIKTDLHTRPHLLPTGRQGLEKILIVDAESSLRDLMASLLKTAGYRTVTAGSGLEAVDIWQREQGNFDLLLIDLLMPQSIPGARLAQVFQSENPKLKILFTSGYGEAADPENAPASGRAWLAKPFAPHKLLAAVRASLNGQTPLPP